MAISFLPPKLLKDSGVLLLFACLFVCLKGQGGRSRDKGRTESAGTFNRDVKGGFVSKGLLRWPLSEPCGSSQCRRGSTLAHKKADYTSQSFPGAAYSQKEVYYQKIVPERSKAHRHQTQEERI